ncbi:MAG: hypothetical protein ACLQVI_33295, partial [Polyangiaceae bacterium]
MFSSQTSSTGTTQCTPIQCSRGDQILCATAVADGCGEVLDCSSEINNNTNFDPGCDESFADAGEGTSSSTWAWMPGTEGCPMPFDAGPPSMSTAPTWPEFDAGLLPGGPASQTIFGATPANQFLGPIATDGDQVFWVAESSTGATPLLACAVTGCPDNTPQVVWPESSWGPNGGLVVVGGRVYFFEETFNSDAGTYGGAIVDCPVSGCGAAPTTFAAIQTQVDYVEDTPGLVTDGASLYWIDGQAVLACDLGGACAAPRTVATLPAGASASATATDGSSLFWIQYTSDGNPASIESVSTAGGNLTEACSVAPEYG